MEVELWSGDSKAIIDPKGAWLTNLSDSYGDVLFPRRQLADEADVKRTRGGSHVCMPNFGPGGQSGLAQHGFGRTSVWNTIDQTESSILLALDKGDGDYADMMALMTYQLADGVLLGTLEMTNNSDKPLRAAPGFHPYIVASQNEPIVIDGVTYKPEELSETEFIDGAEHELITSAGMFRLRSDELHRWAIWTDSLGEYVCVEPTLAGFSFRDQPEPTEEELLPPGVSRQYGFSLSWQR